MRALTKSFKRRAWRALALVGDELALYRWWYNLTRPKTGWDRRPSLKRLRGSTGGPHLDRVDAVADRRWLVVCPAWDRRPGEQSGPGQGQFFYEIVQTAIDRYGAECVSSVLVEKGDVDWRARVAYAVRDFGATHVLCQIEIDPDSSSGWTYDLLLDELRSFWTGTFVMLLYDSVYPLHLARVDRITSRDGNCLVAAIDRVVSGLYRGPAPCVGPLLLPISGKSLRLLDKAVAASTDEGGSGLSFIGALYPYRQEALAKFGRAGIAVNVNPQQSTLGHASYDKYVSALAASGSTLNLARAHAFDVPQLKCRVLEAAAFQCVVFSDEETLTGTFFRPDLEFVHFTSAAQLAQKLEHYRENPGDLAEIRRTAFLKARALASSSFWECVEAGLK